MRDWLMVGRIPGWTAATAVVLFFAASAQAHVISSFQAGDGGWQLGTIAVGNIDSDPELEIIVPSRNSLGLWMLDAFDHTGARVTGFPFNALTSPINVSPTLFDLDGNGTREIIFTCGTRVVALRGNGTAFWQSTVGPSNYIPDAGFMSVTNGFYLAPVGLFSPTLPLTAEFSSEVSPPLIVDANGDGALEVITAWKINPGPGQDFNPVVNDLFGGNEWGSTGEVWSGGVVHMDVRTGALGTIYHFHQLVESGLAAAQLDDDPVQEILVLNDADSVVAYDSSKTYGLLGKGMLHGMFGKNQRFLSGSYQTGVDVHGADIDGDGRDEALVPSSRIDPNWQPMATILDDDGAIIWREWHNALSLPRTHGWFNSATMIPVNPDDDNRVDVLVFMHGHELDFKAWNGVELVSRPGWPRSFAPRLPSAPVVGDVDGDGQEEIVLGTYDPGKNPSDGLIVILSLNGATEYSEAIPGGVKHVPALADVNNDGSMDLVFRSLAGRVYVMNFGATANARVSWATHRGNMERNGRPMRPLFPPGTPIIQERRGSYTSNYVSWRGAFSMLQGFEVYRATDPAGPFARIATLPATAREFVDLNVEAGTLYIYEVGAMISSRPVRSAPTAILADLNANLAGNGGFEEDDDSHWDKWFSGDIPWQNMRGSSVSRSGRRSMEIRLDGHRSNSSITQFSHYGVPESYLRVTTGKLYSFGGFIKSGGLSAASQHWFEWDSSKTGESTNNRPPLPWPNYFTPAASFNTAASPWIYANRVLQMPAGFPNIQLRHRFTTASSASGSVYLDDVFFRELPPPQDARWVKLLPFGSGWRYATNVTGDWAAETFNDAAWKIGSAKFGAGVAQNVKTPLPAKLPAYYFRTRFNSDAAEYSEFLLSATATDEYGGKVYPLRVFLNGTELHTSGIEAVSGEGNIVKHYDLAPFIPLLRQGGNTIAVMLSNVWQPTWDNVAFDLELTGIRSDRLEEGPRFLSVQRLASGAIELRAAGPAGTTWTVQASDTYPFNWRAIGTLSFAASPVAYVDSSATALRRYYRFTR